MSIQEFPPYKKKNALTPIIKGFANRQNRQLKRKLSGLKDKKLVMKLCLLEGFNLKIDTKIAQWCFYALIYKLSQWFIYGRF